MQRYREAKKSFDQAIKARPQVCGCVQQSGRRLLRRTEIRGGGEGLPQAIAIDGSSASFYSNLGAALFAKKDFEPAVLAYRARGGD